MSTLAVIGGTGYAGSALVDEAAQRGHHVTAISRTAEETSRENVEYKKGTLLNVPELVKVIGSVDVVVFAVSPRGDMAGGVMRRTVSELIAALPQAVRVGVVGGAGGSLVQPGGPRLIDTPDFPEALKAEAGEVADILTDLQDTADERDWFYVHPAGNFGAFAPGERTGHYRDGGDVIVLDEQGQSNLSSQDLAVAIVDEIETPKHHRERFTVGY